MRLALLKSKIHRAKVTQCDANYEGSVSVDVGWLEEVGILPYEQVDVLNITNGERFTTYAIEAERGSKIIGINGAAAHLAKPGDLVIIVAYAYFGEDEARQHMPKIIDLNMGS